MKQHIKWNVRFELCVWWMGHSRIISFHFLFSSSPRVLSFHEALRTKVLNLRNLPFHSLSYVLFLFSPLYHPSTVLYNSSFSLFLLCACDCSCACSLFSLLRGSPLFVEFSAMTSPLSLNLSRLAARVIFHIIHYTMPMRSGEKLLEMYGVEATYIYFLLTTTFITNCYCYFKYQNWLWLDTFQCFFGSISLCIAENDYNYWCLISI